MPPRRPHRTESLFWTSTNIWTLGEIHNICEPLTLNGCVDLSSVPYFVQISDAWVKCREMATGWYSAKGGNTGLAVRVFLLACCTYDDTWAEHMWPPQHHCFGGPKTCRKCIFVNVYQKSSHFALTYPYWLVQHPSHSDYYNTIIVWYNNPHTLTCTIPLLSGTTPLTFCIVQYHYCLVQHPSHSDLYNTIIVWYSSPHILTCTIPLLSGTIPLTSWLV